jgi:hypothetical protein
MGLRKKIYGKPLKKQFGGYKVKPELGSNGNPTGKFSVITGRKTVHATGLTSTDALIKAEQISLGIKKK